MNTWVRICVHYTHSLNLNEFINLLDVRFSMKSETLMSSNCKQTSFFFYSYVFILEKVSPVSMKKKFNYRGVGAYGSISEYSDMD